MNPKLLGCCTKCDVEVFEIKQRNPETRIALQLGAPLENAVRTTFILADGSRMDLTFCAECRAGLLPADFQWLWQRVQASWVAESGAAHPCVKEQASNMILAMSHSQPWRDVRG